MGSLFKGYIADSIDPNKRVDYVWSSKCHKMDPPLPPSPRPLPFRRSPLKYLKKENLSRLLFQSANSMESVFDRGMYSVRILRYQVNVQFTCTNLFLCTILV